LWHQKDLEGNHNLGHKIKKKKKAHGLVSNHTSRSLPFVNHLKRLVKFWDYFVLFFNMMFICYIFFHCIYFKETIINKTDMGKEVKKFVHSKVEVFAVSFFFLIFSYSWRLEKLINPIEIVFIRCLCIG